MVGPARITDSVRRLRASWFTHAPVGWAVMPTRCLRWIPCSIKNSTYRRRKNTVSTWKKSAARIVFAWACRNARQVCPARLGAGSMSASLRICHACAVPKLAPYSELAFPVPVRPLCKARSTT